MLVPLCWWQVIHFFLTWKLCRHSFVQTAKTMAVKVRTMEWEPIQWSVVNNYGIFLSLCAVVSGSLVGKQLHCRRAFKNIFLKGEDTASWTKAVCFMSRSSTPTSSLLLLESVFQGRIGKSRLVNQRSGKVGKKEDSRGSRDQESFKKVVCPIPGSHNHPGPFSNFHCAYILHLLLVGPKPPDVVGERITRWPGGPRRRITQQDDKLFDRNWKECFFQQESHKK